MKTADQSTAISRNKKQPFLIQVAKRIAENKAAVAGGIILLVIILIAICAPFVAPYDPNEYDMLNCNAKPSWEHLCGTDNLGRDCFSRLIYGARFSLSMGLCAALAGAAFGIVIGSVAGYFGGIVETVIMRLMDIMSAIPGILLAIIISAVLGGGFLNTVIALSVGSIPGGVRMIRAQILSQRNAEYIEAAHSINCNNVRIMFKHLLPNVVSPLIVSSTMAVGRTITEAAALSFIGLGVQPPTAEWGAMLSAGRKFIMSYPHLVIFPGLCIGITVLCVNLFGDGLRDALDPKLKT